MTFSEDIRRFNLKVERLTHEVFASEAGIVAETMNSIVFGSPLTGAPGQPVDTGRLRASWQAEFPDETTAIISTNVPYAPIIEENIRGAQLRSAVGGFHSVKLTILGFQRIVDNVVTRLSAGGKP